MIDEDLVRDWIVGYERAWRAPGGVDLADLFTEDASYQTAPFREPHHGLASIRQMWEAERDRDDESFTFAFEVLAVTAPRAVARIHVRYDPPDGQEYRDLWVIELADDGRCRAFEEWPFWPEGTPGAPAG